MNKHHPLDEVFRSGLKDQAAATPLHLWEQIDQKRTPQHRLLNQVRQKKPVALLLASTIIAGIALLVWNVQQPELQGFPVLAPATTESALAEQSEVAPRQGIQSTVPQKLSASAAAAPTKQTVENTQALRMGEAMATHAIEAVKTTTSDVTSGTIATARLLNTSEQEDPSVRPKHVPDLPLLRREPDASASLDERYLSGLFGSNDPKCARFGDGNWAIYIDIMASPDLTFNTLEARDADARDYLEKRKETESRLFAFSGGIRLSMIADNGIALRTGVNYSQINEKFTYFNGSEEITQTRNVYDSDGNVIGTDTITLTGERYKVSNNIYRTIDIPFILGYEFEAGQFGLSVNGGAYLNLLFMPDGDLLDPATLEPIAIDRNGFDAFKEQVGLGYYGSLGVTYQTRNGLQLLLEPHFKVFPRSITHDEYALTQRYTSIGLFMGVRKRL